MSESCRAFLTDGHTPCRNPGRYTLRGGDLPVCGVHFRMARFWLARGDVPAWVLQAEDYGEQQALSVDELEAPGRVTVRVVA